MKFLIIGPVSLVLLVRVRIQEAAARRRARRQSKAADSLHYTEASVA